MFVVFILLKVLGDISFLGTTLIGETAVTAKLVHSVRLIMIGIKKVSTFLTLNRGLATEQIFLQVTYLFKANFFGFTGWIIAL